MVNKINMKTIMNKMFSKVDNVVLDVTSGKLGISHEDDTFSLGEDESINSGALMSLPVPAFATKIKLGDINPGDILVHNGKAHGFVLKSTAKAKSLRVIQPSGVTSTMHIKNDLLTGSGWMIVKSMFGGMDNNMLPMLAMMGDDTGTDSDMMYPMLMMSMMNKNGGSNDSAANPMQNMMLPLMMMSGDGDSSMSKMLPMMMMMNGGLNFAPQK
jgi:hypothetical protein